jgi:hypothetical protein
MWPGVGPRLMPIPGALHIYREGEPVGMPHVMYLPGGTATSMNTRPLTNCSVAW